MQHRGHTPQTQHLRRRGVVRGRDVLVERRLALPLVGADRRPHPVRQLPDHGQQVAAGTDGRPRRDLVPADARAVQRTRSSLPVARRRRRGGEDGQDGRRDRRPRQDDRRDADPRPGQRHGRRRDLLDPPARRPEHLPHGRLLHRAGDQRPAPDLRPHVPQHLHSLRRGAGERDLRRRSTGPATDSSRATRSTSSRRSCTREPRACGDSATRRPTFWSTSCPR